MRLVDADKMVQIYGDWLVWAAVNGKLDDPEYAETAKEKDLLLRAFRDAPTCENAIVNNKEVLRCKDCVNSCRFTSSGWCRCLIQVRDMPQDGYCSFGKPKKGAENGERAETRAETEG